MATKVYDHNQTEEISSLLIGRKVVEVVGDRAELDDGTILIFEGNDGGCSCSAGCYDLTDLNRVDNVITKVEFEDLPDGNDYDGDGVYKIFVFADNERINLATFVGTDGSGYYGTGYTIIAKKADE